MIQRLRRPIIISIHDVHPPVLSKVQAAIRLISHELGMSQVDLLVVPGAEWSRPQLDLLRRWQDQGIHLLGHGWNHRCRRIQTLYHRVHSWLISRDVAEHLSETETTICGLIDDCYAWFVEHGFQPPQMYVPPAWAMGPVSRQALAQRPFRYFEYLLGVFDSETDHFVRCAMVGYEADTVLRALTLRAVNRLNLAAGRWYPLRVSIHPHDFQLKLAASLRRLLKRISQMPVGTTVSVPQWLSGDKPSQRELSRVE